MSSAASKMVASTLTYPHEVTSWATHAGNINIIIALNLHALCFLAHLSIKICLLHQPLFPLSLVKVVRSYMHVSGSGPIEGLALACR